MIGPTGASLRRSTQRYYCGVRAQSTLSHKIFENASSTPTKTAFVLHGILGNKSNWRTFSQKLANARPDWRFVAIDSRGHGDSPLFGPPHTLSACARDLLNLADTLHVEPDAIFGHSFGGKVALKYLDECRDQSRKVPEQVWVLDSLPGNAKNDYSNRKLTASIERVLPALKSIPLPIHNKSKLITDLTEQGISLGEAQWLTTNLKLINATPETYDWKMDVPVIENLFQSFLATDLWHVVNENDASNTHIHFVQAERSKMWNNVVTERLRALKEQGIHHHVLRNSDHWVHIDNPNDLLDMILKH